jgi:hypothetical protein
MKSQYTNIEVSRFYECHCFNDVNMYIHINVNVHIIYIDL